MTSLTAHRPRALAALAAAAVLLLSACGGPTDTSSEAASPASSIDAVPESDAAGTDDDAPDAGALDFRATTVDGADFDGVELAGEPVAMWFWAPWCTICRAEAPSVAEAATEYDGKVTMLGVPGLGEVDAMQEFVSDTDTGGFRHVVDSDGSLWSKFDVVAQPAFVFVDSSGNAETFAGSLGADELRDKLDALD